MSRYDTIKDVTVAKTFDEIVEVNKFNPFHDAMGRFSSSNGFKSYSANPNTRAGAMAIARSAAAGHGSTLNVHRDSQGETIRRNANWLARGAQGVPTGTQGSSVLRRVVEPTAGLSGASAAGSSWQHQNQQAGRTTTGGKQPAQKPAQQQATQKPQTQQKPQQTQQTQQKPQTQGAQTDRQPVDGVDLVAKLGKNAVKNMTTEEILKAQGMDGLPQVVKGSKQTIDSIVNTRNVAVRSWDGDDAATRAAYDDQLKNGDFYTKCEGGNKLGRGMYVAFSSAATQSTKGWNQKDGDIDYEAAMTDSSYYGKWHVNMSLDPSAKLITRTAAENMARRDGFRSSGWSDDDSVFYDVGAYAAAKGYDGIIDHVSSSRRTGTVSDFAGARGTYVNVLNRTKVIIYDASGDDGAGDLRRTTRGVNSNGNISTSDTF